jgi:hypothetical protein
MSQVFLALLSSWAKFWIFNNRREAVDLSMSRFIYLNTYLWIVHLPKFKIVSMHELNDLLKNLGLLDMFDESKASFSGETNQSAR